MPVRLRSTKVFLAAALLVVTSAACSSAKKKTTPELSRMEGKKVALIEVQGEATSQKVVEVALVNQLLKHGSFILVPKQDVDAARVAIDSDAADWKSIAKKAGAEVALRARVLSWDATTRDGYSKEVVEDSQMAAERGEEYRNVERLYKVKSMTGEVKVELQFASLADDDIRYATAESTEVVNAEGNKGGIHLPPKLRFLEKVTNDAFAKFFKQYN